MTYMTSTPILDASQPHLTVRSDHGEQAKVLKDSISEQGHRLTTFELTYYRGVHSEMMTHRAFSRNSASSRAIPVHKMISSVMDNPYVPEYWGKYQKGMQAHEEVSNPQEKKVVWLQGRNRAVQTVIELLYDIRLPSNSGEARIREALAMCDLTPTMTLDNAPHKQLVNRILEPYMWHKVVLTGTSFDNFFNLRNHVDADPAIQAIAALMASAYTQSLPEAVRPGQWHLPLLDDSEANQLTIDEAQRISAARCARTSYLTHDGIRNFTKDFELFDKLVTGKPHLSPLEHVATPTQREGLSNFIGWNQLRTQLFGRTL